MKFLSKCPLKCQLRRRKCRKCQFENNETDIGKPHWRYQKHGIFAQMSEMSVLKTYTLRVEGSKRRNILSPIKCAGGISQKLTKLTFTLKNLIFDSVTAVFRCQFRSFKTDKCQFQTDISVFTKRFFERNQNGCSSSTENPVSAATG
jgi:hypothetical protein